MPFCRYCGKAVTERDRFCRACGKEIEDGLTRLAKRLKSGDFSDFDAFYEQTNRYVYVVIAQYMKQAEDIWDVMQNTYLTAYQSFAQLKDASQVKSWLGRIAQNKAIDSLRKNKHEELAQEDDSCFEELAEVDIDLLPEDIMQNKEKQRLLREIIDNLPELQKEVILFFYYNEMKVEEIALALSIPEGTVKTHLYRARAKIKEGVEKLEKNQGTRLYSVGFAPFVLFLLTSEEKSIQVSKAVFDHVLHAVHMHLGHTAITGAQGALAGSLNGAHAGAGIAGNSGAAVSEGGTSAMSGDASMETAAASTGAAATVTAVATKSFLLKALLITAVSLSVAGGTTALYMNVIRSTPEKTIATFEKNVNHLNTDGMIQCFEPDVQMAYHGLLSVINGITGQDATQIIDSFLQSISIDVDPNQVMHLDFDVKKIEYPEKNRAEVTVLIKLKTTDGKVQEDTEIMTMKKIDGTWYIAK